MINTLLNAAPTIGLLFFFCIFTGIMVWAMLPSNKRKLQSYGDIPLKEDDNGGQ